ncbi:MAG: dsrE [Dehalococcoidales bacterium]|nr:dsrE [Dehalococcoidales bacterium]
MANITVVLGESPYGKERPYTTLRFVLAALVSGHTVHLFLLEEAVFLAKRGQKPMELPSLLEHEAMPNCEEILKAAIKQGATVKVCGVCASERGLSQEELVEGAEISTIHTLVDWVVSGDKVVFF